MRIYFNRRPVEGPWGGGSKILNSVIKECLQRGHNIYFDDDLHKLDRLDVIFCFDPRPSQQVNYSDLLNKRRHTGAKLIQRVGDLGTHGKPELTSLVAQTCNFADCVVFPSLWAKLSLESLTGTLRNAAIIENAPLPCFITERKAKDFSGTIKIVSHHWSNNAMKGFEIYAQLDDFCQKSNGKYEFTFIGRKPENINFSNHIGPKDANELVDLLSNKHVYVTASKYEAGANHVLEALGVNLPVLYHKEGGSIVDYCKHYGLMFDTFENLQYCLENKMNDIENIFNNMNYVRSTFEMSKEYVDLIEKIKNES